MPGTLVLIGVQRPRYSAGASGFMSYISMCPGPPSSQRRMTDVSFLDKPAAAEAACTWRSCGKPTAAIPATPSCKKLRRDCPSQYLGLTRPASMRNMAGLLGGVSRRNVSGLLKKTPDTSKPVYRYFTRLARPRSTEKATPNQLVMLKD